MSISPLPGNQTSIAQVRSQLTTEGACWLAGIDATTTEELLTWAERLGSWNLGIAEELLGPRIMHMRYDSAKDSMTDQPAYFTNDEFPLHTDVSYVPDPPGLMLMHCVKPDPAGGGQVLLAQCNAALRILPADAVASLQRPVFRFLYPPACPAGTSEPAAILNQGRLRFKYSGMRFADEYAPAVEALYQALKMVSFKLCLRAGDLLIVDNHRMAHGRTAFGATSPAAHAADSGRHIMRCYVNAADWLP